MHPFPGCSLVCIPCRPESRGWLRIKSPDPTVLPAIQPNYLGTRGDRETMVAGLQDRPRASSRRRRCNAMSPRNSGRASDVQTDEGWLDHVRRNGSTTFHQVATCMMGGHPTAVVDNELRVHGMEGLRVVDASVMPTVISGNTNAATIMIAEKAADLIRAERAGRPPGGIGQISQSAIEVLLTRNLQCCCTVNAR